MFLKTYQNVVTLPGNSINYHLYGIAMFGRRYLLRRGPEAELLYNTIIVHLCILAVPDIVLITFRRAAALHIFQACLVYSKLSDLSLRSLTKISI